MFLCVDAGGWVRIACSRVTLGCTLLPAAFVMLSLSNTPFALGRLRARFRCAPLRYKLMVPLGISSLTLFFAAIWYVHDCFERLVSRIDPGSPTALETTVTQTTWIAAGTLVAVQLILAQLTSILFKRYVERPLERIAGGVRRRGMVDEATIPMSYPDEIGRLAAFLNQAFRATTVEAAKNQELIAKIAVRERELIELVDHAVIGMQRLDANGIVSWANRCLLDAMGYAADDYVGRSLADFCLEPDAAKDVIERVQRFERLTDYPLRMRARDGRVRHCRLDATAVFEDGRFRHTRCFVRDLTQVTETMQSLRETEQRFRTLSESVPAVIFQTDADGKTVYINRRWEEMTGQPEQRTYGLGWTEVVHPDDYPRVVGEWKRVAMHGLPYRLEHRFLHALTGATIWASCEARPLRRPDGEFLGYVGVCLDITQSRQARIELQRSLAENAETRAMIEEQAVQLQFRNQELEQARSKAEAATESKSRFLANMSHELRTPMTSIIGFSESLMNDDPHLAAEQRAAVETIRRNGYYLLELINDILDLSKIEADKMRIERVECLLTQLVREVVELMSPRAAEKKLTLRVEYRSAVPQSIETDPTRLRQVLINLLGNAIKFTQRGEVRLIVGIDLEAEGSPLRFDVVDTGIGISNEQMAVLFQPFTQADASTTRQFGGTGLGLSISRRLAQMLGGEITVASRAGQGSTFTLRTAIGDRTGVPYITPQTTSWPGGRAAVEGQASRLECRILLAEDGPDNQRLIAHLLRRAGATVEVVENGRQAVAAALGAQPLPRPFDIILMDMQMPVMDGYTAVRQLRESGYTGPIVALTANAMAGDREKCLDAGCDDYAVKPIDRAVLFETLQRHLTPCST